MYQPDDAVLAGFLDRVVSADAVDASLADILKMLRSIDMPSHALAKKRLRRPAIEAMQAAIDAELTLAAYEANAQRRASVIFQRAGRIQPIDRNRSRSWGKARRPYHVAERKGGCYGS
jgi:hypothetical protein